MVEVDVKLAIQSHTPNRMFSRFKLKAIFHFLQGSPTAPPHLNTSKAASKYERMSIIDACFSALITTNPIQTVILFPVTSGQFENR